MLGITNCHARQSQLPRPVVGSTATRCGSHCHAWRGLLPHMAGSTAALGGVYCHAWRSLLPRMAGSTAAHGGVCHAWRGLLPRSTATRGGVYCHAWRGLLPRSIATRGGVYCHGLLLRVAVDRGSRPRHVWHLARVVDPRHAWQTPPLVAADPARLGS